MSDKHNARILISKGTPLREAQYKFGNPALVKKHTEFGKRDLLAESLQKFADAYKNQSFGSPDLAKSQADLMDSNLNKRDLERDVQSRLLTGHLIGVGYEVPRKTDDAPRIIPADVWEGNVDWMAGEVTGHGCHFAHVHIVEQNQDNITKPRPGRPSAAPLVEAAFNELLNEGSIEIGSSLSSYYTPIRERVWHNNPSLNNSMTGMSDKALEKHIGRLVTEAKSRR